MLTTRLASTGSALLGASRRQLSTLACRGLPTPRRVPNVATLFRARGQPHVLQSGGVRHLSSSAASGFGLLPVLRARATSVLRLAASKVPKGFEGFFRRGASGAFKKLKEKQKDVQKKVRGDGANEERAAKASKKRADPDGDGGGGGGAPWWQTLGVLGTIALAMNLLAPSTGATAPAIAGEQVSFQEFKKRFLQPGRVSHIVVVNRNVAKVHISGDGSARRDNVPRSASASGSTGPKLTGSQMAQERSTAHFTIGSVDSFERNLELAQLELGIDPDDFVPVHYATVSETNMGTVLLQLAPLAGLFLLGFMMLRMFSGGPMGGAGGRGGPGGIFSIGKANPKQFNKETDVKTTFKDVAGLDEAKVEVMEFVHFLKHPERYTRLGAKLPKGALLVGPPGTGKTLLARATAGEASVPFFSMSGSDFIEMFVGVGPSRVRDLFKQAKEASPCIVFIDEIDAVGRARGRGGFNGGNDERENTLNQLLVEMDGFATNTNIVVIAGTNRSDILDPALTRPGRFDRQILVDVPDIRGRRDILEVHLAPLKLSDAKSEVAGRLAALTPGMSGADLANLCNEAALIAARKEKEFVELVDFEAASDRVIGGIEKPNRVVSPKERERVAYHEAGHAVVGWFLSHADPVLKVTIVPRGQSALGFAQYLPNEVSLYERQALLDKICMALGGRAAEEVTYGTVTTGAADDLKRVTQMAYSLVSIFGMSEKVGQVSFPPREDGAEFQKPYSEETAQTIDREVREIVDAMYKATLKIVKDKHELIEKLALALLEKETLNHDAIVSILGPRPHANNTYDQFLKLSAEERLKDEEKQKNKVQAAEVHEEQDKKT